MFKFDGFEFDQNSAKLVNTADSNTVFLRQKLVALLVYLLTHQTRVVSKQELLDELWEHGQYRERSLSQSILELRKALGDSATSPKFIRTFPNQGYQWICPESVDSKVELTELRGVKKRFMPPKIWFLSLIILIITMVSYWADKQLNTTKKSVDSFGIHSEKKQLKVIVLPFINQSGTSAMNWVQYGLSEMLAYDLALIKQLDVVAPTQLNTGMFNAKFSDETVQKLLTKHSADVAVRSVFSLQKNQQIFSYKLLTATYSSEEKQLNRSDLAVSMPDIASEIYRDIQPNKPVFELPKYAYTPRAMHDFARGLQALQSEGYILAQYYFQASMQIDKNHHWSVLYHAISQLHLGYYNKAEALLADLEMASTDSVLLASINYWQSLIFYRKGLFSESTERLKSSIKQLEISPQQQISAMVTELNIKLSMSTNLSVGNKVLEKSSSLDQKGLFEVPLFNGIELLTDFPIENIELMSRQLTVKRHKPALFRLLISHSLSKSLTYEQRNSAIARAVEIISELQQPYDLAIALTIQGRIAIADKNPLANVYLTKAKQIAKSLKTPPLLAEIEFYLRVSDIISTLDLDDDQGSVKAQVWLQNFDRKSLDAHKKELFLKAEKWILEHQFESEKK